MYVKFWGTRGSIASPGPRTAKFGGNTSCVEVRAADDTLIVLDCGTGARDLGLHLAQCAPKNLRVHLFIGHTHWDHIQGFPFFAPAFLPGAEVNIYAPLGFQRSLEDVMAGQMESSYFPVKLRDLRSRLHFTELDEGFFRIGEVVVETQYLNHTAPTIAYRLTSGNATVAYVTDHEPFWRPDAGTLEHPGDQRHVAFLRDAHLVIHDAQYTHDEYQARVGWGHSSINYATDVALSAGAQRLALFHHDPTHDDATMERLESEARARVLAQKGSMEVFAAAEGLEVEVKGERSATTVAIASAFRRLPLAGRRVAVVVPDEVELTSIERELAEDNLLLVAMSDGATAVDRIASTAPDLAIVSNRLPDGDGRALITPLRQAMGRSDFPIVLLIDDQGSDDLWTGGAVPTDYVARPYSPPMLRARVRAWLSRSLAERELQMEGSAGAQAPVLSQRQAAIATSVEALAATPLFRGLDETDLEILAQHAIDETYEKGRVIVREGSAAQSVYVIVSGRVRITETSRETQAELQLSELGPGQVFGELGALRNQPRVANVVAVERTRCLVVPPASFLQALERVPRLALGLLQVLAARLADADRRVARFAPDPLTGLMSSRAFQDQYRRLAASSRRRGTGALLLVLDVQHLREINDRFGYAIGDEVLKAVAEALVETTRSTDVVCRYGADEFAALLVDVVVGDTERLVTRVEKRLGDNSARRSLPLEIRCSIGAAFSPTPPHECADLMREADLDLRRRRSLL